MGIYSRDYLRDDDGDRRGEWRDFDPIKWIIIINVAVFVLQVVWQHDTERVVQFHPQSPPETVRFTEPVLNQWFALERSAIFGGQVWRLLTYEFLHDHHRVWHLFFNMYFLWLAGKKVESFYGPREFLMFYLVAGVLSGLFSVFWFEAFGSRGWSAIGASGAVAAVFILYALNWPFDIFRLFGIIPVQAMWLAILNVVLDVFPMLQQIGAGAQDNIAHSAHVGGMLFALFYQRREWRLSPYFDRVRKVNVRRVMRPKPSLRVFEPDEPPVDLEGRVDELLAKVAQHGEASLTDAERAELVAASRRYKDKQR